MNRAVTSLAHQRGNHVPIELYSMTEVPLVSYNSGSYDAKGTRCIACFFLPRTLDYE